METRIYAIKETEDVHEISNDDFMTQAEDLGYVWSLTGFQNEINREGQPSINSQSEFNELHFRFIDVPTSEKDYANKCCVKNEDGVYTLQCDKKDDSDEKSKCSECGCLEDIDNALHTDVFDAIVCDECGNKSHCFCEECSDYVPTSHCSAYDYIDDVDGIQVETTQTLCNVCIENMEERK